MKYKVPLESTILLHNFNYERNTSLMYVFHKDQTLDNASPSYKGRISFTYDKNKLRPFRFEQISGNSYRFLRVKDLIDTLTSARIILINFFDKPKKTNEFLEFVNYYKLPKPKLIQLCEVCISSKKKVTQLKQSTTYNMYGKEVCRGCAVAEIKEEYTRRGIPITTSARKYYSELITRKRSVEEVVSNLWEAIQSTKKESKTSTKFDEIPADDLFAPKDMKASLHELNLTDNIAINLIDNWYNLGINKLLPAQILALKNGLLEKEDLLVVAGTSSGKTFIGEIAGVNNWKNDGSKFVFLTPLVALTNQKFESFKKRYRDIGARVTIRVGMSKIDTGEDIGVAQDGNFSKADIIVATFEAFDWILRSGNWKKIGKIGTLVIDEVQLLSDPERGVELDGIIGRIRTIFPKCQLIGLSATIGHPGELAKELGLKLVEYSKRPIPLERHLLMVNNHDERVELISSLIRKEIVKISSYRKRGQSMIFTNTRRRVQELASLLKMSGLRVVYYHAGLTYYQRKKIEIGFENGDYDAVVTTMALGAGADFPVSQVIFERPGMGARWLTIAEYHQMSGRAGRFGYHDYGKSMLIATPGEKIYASQDKSEEQAAFDLMVGEIEDIEGEVDFENESDQVLAIISSINPISQNKLVSYYSNLFFNTSQLKSILESLTTKGLIVVKDGNFYVTALGRALSESFLLPNFGFNIAKKMNKYTVRQISIEIAPIESVYVSKKVHARLEQAMKTKLSQRFFSDGILDLITNSVDIKKLPPYTINRIKEWIKVLFDCKCKENPYCVHPRYKLSNIILDLRLEGLNVKQIVFELNERFDIFVYQGDLLNWLDEVMHALHSVGRISKSMKYDNILSESKNVAHSLENPNYTGEILKSINTNTRVNSMVERKRIAKGSDSRKSHSSRKITK
ncbi:MAG: DUF5814 domain-containing protein [Candidatus Heimdallarchaeota archaeon]|nr:DUF5814 domain-containing protein [Candidatus Heimdallarchaeota archaeon]